jgi:hypothetical protein
MIHNNDSTQPTKMQPVRLLRHQVARQRQSSRDLHSAADEVDLPTPVSARIGPSDTSLLLDADRVAVEKNLLQRERERTAEEIARRRKDEAERTTKERRRARNRSRRRCRRSCSRSAGGRIPFGDPPAGRGADVAHQEGDVGPIFINDQHPMYNIITIDLNNPTITSINNALRDERLRQRKAVRSSS